MPMLRSSLVFIFVSLATALAGAHAASAAPPSGESAAPLPPERPPELSSPPPAAAEAVPLPPERPSDLASPQPAPQNGKAPEPAPAQQAAAPPPDDDPECPERLARLGVRSKALPAIAEGACGATTPLEVAGLPDGVAVSPPVTLTCRAAEALALWSRDVVGVAADKELSAPLSRIVIGTSYQCRSQNHQQGAKLSEHAFANGVDVAGFEFHKHAAVTIGKADPEGPEGRFADASRTGACRLFTTVLGPGTNAEHADHLHLDMRDRRNGYRICQ
ncbi:extensin-like domain-containing protein [Alsobacter metallidurans]|nr:extensin family protein [Alsobacter metallidurans]